MSERDSPAALNRYAPTPGCDTPAVLSWFWAVVLVDYVPIPLLAAIVEEDPDA